MKKRIVIALGHRALGTTLPEQKKAVKTSAAVLADMVEEGYQLVITHSNAPQVGMIHTAMNEFGKTHPDYTVAPMSVCSAMSQGYIGYDLQNAVRAELLKRGIFKTVSTILTQVIVDPYDDAFHHPVKVIGRYMDAKEAEAEEQKGNYVKEEPGKGYRRIVAAPMPKSIVEIDAIKTLVQNDQVVIACGGGGIPVLQQGNELKGASAIIEKDYRDGIRAMDLNQELVQRKDRPVGETVLAKMEWVILNDTMPPAKFAVVHWGSRLSDQDKKDILTWVAQTRKAHYATDAAPEHANEPIQPIPHRLPVDEAKVALGKTLFNDARLSADSTVACATCHAMDKAGTDNARFSEGIRKQLGDVNAPTTFNAVFNFVQFWDGRAADLQEQAGGPPLNPIEMGSKDWDEIVARLAADAELTAKFRAVYPDGWSGKNITDAIAEYEKTLISPDSRFDRWLRGDKSALTAAEVEGYERFKAYRCASCHVGKSMGGQSYEYLDLKKDYFADRGGKPLGSDKGRFNASGKEEDMHRFKVPNLRNVELTHPYLHDGTVTTLDEAVRILGIYCSGLDVPQKDRALIVGFLRTLTGQHEGRPVQGEAVAR